MTFAQLSARAGEMIGQRGRYAHCVRVARLGERLAAAHGQEPVKARIAGMLHDLARLWSRDRLLHEAQRRSLPIDAFEARNPIVLHARLGAALAREHFGIEDEDILHAIRSHTLGSPAMPALSEIVYLADALEPGRPFADRAAFERLAFTNVHAALEAVLRSAIADMRRQELEVAPQTDAALQWYAGIHG